MRFFQREKPKIKVETIKHDGFSGWLKCTHCLELVHTKEIEDNLYCCPKCDFHFRLPASVRIELLADQGTFKPIGEDLGSVNPLDFVDSKPYPERLEKAKEQSGLTEAIQVGTCTLDGHPIALGVMDFNFMGGSMGSVVGERVTLLIENAMQAKLPLVLVTTSGGARMQESILSLMQMAKTAAALSRFHKERLPYIVLLTNPTTGGVTASFASLADILLAEPNALICFAGPRVIEQTVKKKLPEEAQKAEFLLQHGLIDCIVKRHELRKNLAFFLEVLKSDAR